MSSSKFFDTYEPVKAIRQISTADDAIAKLFGGDSIAGGFANFQSSMTRKQDEVNSYTLFNYLAVTRIAMKGSQQFPMLGLPSDMGSSKQRIAKSDLLRLSTLEKRKLISRHGGMIIQSVHQEIESLSDDHPLMILLRSVNSCDWWQSFLYELLLFFELTGEAFIWAVPSSIRSANATGGMPVQLWVVPTQWIEPIYAKSGALKAYRVTPNNNTRRRRDIDPDEIIPIWMKSPRDKNRGYSPSTAGGPWIDANNAIEESRIHTFGNSITPSVWLKLAESTNIDPKDDEIMDRIKNRWMQRAAGVRKTREPVVIPPGIEVDASGNFKPKEMDFANSSTEVRDNILALRGVNKFVAGFTEGMNRAQVETALIHFCEFQLNPVLGMIGGALQEKLVPKFDPRIRLWFQDCSPDDRQQRLEELRFLASLGLHPNEARAEYGLDPVDLEDYNTGYIPGGLIPLGDNPSDRLPHDEDEQDSSESTEQAALDIYSRDKIKASKNGNGEPHPTEILW